MIRAHGQGSLRLFGFEPPLTVRACLSRLLVEVHVCTNVIARFTPSHHHQGL